MEPSDTLREPRGDKVAVVDEVRERYAAAGALVVTEYRGLNVPDMAELRSALRNAGCEYKVFKNTLVRRALAGDAPDGLIDLLIGPTALAFVESDPGAAAKALKDFAAEHEQLVIKGGVLSGDLLSEAEIRALADLPSRDELLASLAGGLAAPLSQLAAMMNNLVAEVAGLIQALHDKGGAGDAPTTDRADESETPDDAQPEAEAPAEASASDDAPVVEVSDDANQDAESEAAAPDPASDDLSTT